jgi:TPR repeat protein
MWSDPFYDPSHFTFALELALLCSEDPKEQAEGLELMLQKIRTGDTEAMLTLGRHYHRGPRPDYEAACRWYLEAARHGSYAALERLTRIVHYPDDLEMAQCVRNLEKAGIGLDYIHHELPKICKEASQYGSN